MQAETSHPRRVRSFVIRSRRATSSQERALAQLWPQYGIDPKGGPIWLDDLFERSAPVVLEVGFGNGDSLAEMAEQRPAENFIGVDVHRPGVGHLLLELQRRELTNVRVVHGDAVQFMDSCIRDRTLRRIQLFFPDPWPKRKHHKRRIVQKAWVSTAARKLERGGILHMATDWEDYARHMLKIASAEPLLDPVGDTGATFRLVGRPVTRFEQRGRDLGHEIQDLVFRRN